MGACKGKKRRPERMCARAYVSRMCSSALFQSMWHLGNLSPARESFVGSEYASVRERMCASVTSPGVQEVKEQHLVMLKTTTSNVFTFVGSEF